jgi:hypothetical protein
MLLISSSVSWVIRAAEAASMSIRRDMEERVEVSQKHTVKIKTRGESQSESILESISIGAKGCKEDCIQTISK